jgi:hypothetical protein
LALSYQDWVGICFLLLMTTSSGLFKKKRNQGTVLGFGETSNNHWIWLFQTPSKNCFLGNYLTFQNFENCGYMSELGIWFF